MIQGGIFRDDVLGQKSTPGDSQPSVNSELHQSPTGPVKSLQLKRRKHKLHCEVDVGEMRCAFGVNVRFLALRGGEDERSPSIQGAHPRHTGGLDHPHQPFTPSAC